MSTTSPGRDSQHHPDAAAEATDQDGRVGPGGESYVKLAMRNMVRKGRKSLLHFGLTTTGLVGLLLLLASLGQPRH